MIGTPTKDARWQNRRWQASAQAVVLAGSLALLAGCAHHGAAMITSQPSGAEVVDLEDDALIGVTPVKVWWKESGESRKFVNIRLQKNGYRDKTTSFWVTLRHGSRQSAVDNPQAVEVTLDKN